MNRSRILARLILTVILAIFLLIRLLLRIKNFRSFTILLLPRCHFLNLAILQRRTFDLLVLLFNLFFLLFLNHFIIKLLFIDITRFILFFIVIFLSVGFFVYIHAWACVVVGAYFLAGIVLGREDETWFRYIMDLNVVQLRNIIRVWQKLRSFFVVVVWMIILFLKAFSLSDDGWELIGLMCSWRSLLILFRFLRKFVGIERSVLIWLSLRF